MTMDAKRVSSIKARVRKAQTSFNVMGDMILHLEIDAMTAGERVELQEGMLGGRIATKYKYLDEKVTRDYSEYSMGAL